ncbi:uncharacterized protein LOC128551156 [Mercenaria mercenaria]|uniref:uncharacterized protein LOC128551156 n=1 Tax=Mercenaria mercenaria TaxID=6596 RepID=UPI00234F4D53|nr:uncharacterized protein LOC128551156 [Mercenaria mercenaria]XP_053387612.1 uncharacterized protein LOC128551156 [Mercenaria mercenaria]
MKCSSSTSGAKGQSRFCPECGSEMVEDVKIDTAVICNGKLDGKPCQSELIPGQKFCTSCGTKVDQSLFNIQEERCSKCSSLLFPGKPFCAECGQRKKIPSQPSDSINTEIESGNSSQNTIQSQKISDKESRSTKTDLRSSEMQKLVFGKVVGWGVNQKDTSVEVTSPHKSSLFLDKGKAGTQESVRPTKAKSKQSVAPETMENTNNNQSEDEEMKEKNDNDEGSSVNPGTFKEEAEQKYAKDKENKTMATLDNERYLRHILLLTEGGLLVLRGIVTREAARSGQTLEDMLRINKTILNKNLILKGHFVTLFPSASTVNANVQTWDMSLLIAVVKELFKGMSSADTSAISILEAFRTLMHSASMSAKDYDINRLETALRQLASGISKTEKKIEDIIMRTELENIDIQSSLRNDTENTIDTKVQGQEELGNIQGK